MTSDWHQSRHPSINTVSCPFAFFEAKFLSKSEMVKIAWPSITRLLFGQSLLRYFVKYSTNFTSQIVLNRARKAWRHEKISSPVNHVKQILPSKPPQIYYTSDSSPWPEEFLANEILHLFTMFGDPAQMIAHCVINIYVWRMKHWVINIHVSALYNKCFMIQPPIKHASWSSFLYIDQHNVFHQAF